jgi:hypothetical protein
MNINLHIRFFSKNQLNSADFKIELLMEILQTNRNNKTINSSDDSTPTTTATAALKNDDEIKMGEDTDLCHSLSVQEHTLLLLSEVAGIFPDKVLEHVLIMFVFVGTKLARKDDSYSFQIINQIIRTILPAIVDSIHKNETKFDENNASRLGKTVDTIHRHQKQLPFVSSLVCKILQSFVVALPHIPAHRKTLIFNQLLNIIGLNDYLWITVIQSIDFYLVSNTSSELIEFSNSLAKMSDDKNLATIADKQEKKLRNTINACIHSMISLHSQFEPLVVIQSSIYLVAFLNKYLSTLNEKIDSTKKGQAIYTHLACQLDDYNLLQMKYLAYNLLTFVSDSLISEHLIQKLALFYNNNKVNDSDDSSITTTTTTTTTTTNDYTNHFQNLIEKILILILKLSHNFGINNNNNNNNSNELVMNDIRKFHKSMLNKAYDLLERTINLLDSNQFINAIRRLIKHDLLPIRRRVLALLNARLRRQEPTEQETTLLISLIDDLLNSLQIDSINSSTMSLGDKVDIEINNQTVLFSIKLLCKRIGEKNPLAFVKVVKFLIENSLIEEKTYLSVASKKITTTTTTTTIENINLLSSVLLCIGEVCLKLKTSSLIYLNRIIKFCLKMIDVIQAKFADAATREEKCIIFNKSELLILSCITCLLKIIQHMSNFLSPYLTELCHVSCSLSQLVKFTTNENGEPSANSKQIEFKLTQLRSSLATLIPMRLLVPILNEQSMIKEEDNYNEIIGNVEYYMQLARVSIQKANQEDILANIRILCSIFIHLFDLRAKFDESKRNNNNNNNNKNKKKNKDDESMIEDNVKLSKFEDHVMAAFCELTFKLSEDLFKPIFFKLYEWATANDPPKERLITFYRITLK